MLGEDPAVTTWRIALAPRPRFSTGGRHWWRDLVTDAHSCAMQAWFLQAEANAIGYETELREYAEQHPRPRLRDFMVHLSQGGLAPERLEVSPAT